MKLTREDRAINTEKAIREAVPMLKAERSVRSESVTRENQSLKDIAKKFSVSVKGILTVTG